jgi:hypothetical protein
MAQIQYTDPGQFKFTVDITDPVGAPRNADGTQPPPTAFATGVACAILPVSYISGSETAKTQQVVSEVTHQLVFWYDSLPKDGDGFTQLRSRHLIKFRNRTFVILRIKDRDEMRVQLDAICSERNDGR